MVWFSAAASRRGVAPLDYRITPITSLFCTVASMNSKIKGKIGSFLSSQRINNEKIQMQMVDQEAQFNKTDISIIY